MRSPQVWGPHACSCIPDCFGSRARFAGCRCARRVYVQASFVARDDHGVGLNPSAEESVRAGPDWLTLALPDPTEGLSRGRLGVGTSPLIANPSRAFTFTFTFTFILTLTFPFTVPGTWNITTLARFTPYSGIYVHSLVLAQPHLSLSEVSEASPPYSSLEVPPALEVSMVSTTSSQKSWWQYRSS